jgi:hypothetical protein
MSTRPLMTAPAPARTISPVAQMTNRLDDIEQALAADPRNPALWAQLANASWRADDLETAKGAWELAKVLAKPSRHPHVCRRPAC